MKLKILVIITLIAAAVLTSNVYAKVHLWYLPHPDDETIGMADAIYSSVIQGNDNYFIFFTRGGASKARHRLKGADGSTYHLTKKELEKARVKETLAALKVLGVPPENVLFLNFGEGNFPINTVKGVIESYVQLYPDGVHNTVAPEIHENHQILAEALSSLAAVENINTRFYKVYVYGSNDKTGEKMPVKHPDIKKKALSEFEVWDPANGRYAVGKHSVPDLIKNAKKSKYEYLSSRTDVEKALIIKPTSIRVLSDGVGMAYRVNRLKLGVDLLPDFEERVLDYSVYGFYLFPDNIPFVEINSGAGYHNQNHMFWGINAVIFDDFILEYQNYKKLNKIRAGLEFDL
ncbi:MAG: PIG-L family deacetylase [Halothermotrichaceae bacterium]